MTKDFLSGSVSKAVLLLFLGLMNRLSYEGICRALVDLTVPFLLFKLKRSRKRTAIRSLLQYIMLLSTFQPYSRPLLSSPLRKSVAVLLRLPKRPL